MAIVHENPPANLRMVQKEYEGRYILQMGHWARDTVTGEAQLFWEDVRTVPFHLYEEE